MDVIYERCCGLDVHKKSVVACLVVPGSNGTLIKETRTFGTMMQDVLALADWLRAAQCTHVAMESTGVYWKPVYNVLEGQFILLVVNAQHIKAVPGRKTDVRDAEWLADLLRHGLVRGSFIPPVAQRAVRALTRHRTTVIQERARVTQRIQKLLEDTNIKLSAVVTDITGASARDILQALLDGETNPATLAALARGKLRAKHAQLEQALSGQLQAHHRFLLRELVMQLDYLEQTIARVSTEIAAHLQPFEEEIARLDSIPGINRRIAEVLLAEIGPDLQRFPNAAHLASWAGMCPGNNESAGKRMSGKTRKGSPWLRQVLVEAAHGAAGTKQSYLGAQYRRLVARRGCRKALIAVGHSILIIAYHLLTRKEMYRDLGPNYYDELDRHAVERKLVRRLERLGYEVHLHLQLPTGQAGRGADGCAAAVV